MSDQVWDPFEGEVAFVAPSAEVLAQGNAAGRSVGSIGAVVAIFGFAVMLVEWLVFPNMVIEGFPVIGAAVATVGFAMVFLSSDDDSEGRAVARVAARVAADKGWSFQAVRQRNRRTGTGGDGLGGGVVSDPAMEAAYAALGPILLRAVTPVNPQALLRGQGAGRDLWIGVEEMTALNSPGQGIGASLGAIGRGGPVSLRAVVGMRTQTQGRFVADLSMPVRLVEGDGPEAARMAVEPALSGPLLDYGGARMVVQPGAIFVSFPRFEPVKDAAAWIEARVTAVARVADGFEEAA